MLNFVIIKFLALGLNSIRSLLLAAFLGPASYGVFGTLILIQQCLSYTTLGMREGLTVGLARSSNACVEAAGIRASALSWGAGVGALVAVGIAVLHATGLLSPDLLWIGVISFLGILNEMLININRAEEKLRKVAVLELLYNAAPLGVVLYFWKTITVSEVLASLAAGLLLSVTIYLLTLPGVRDWRPSWMITKRLLTIGLPLSIQSGLILLVNSVFIILANRMQSGAELGLVIFSANICTIILFALNAIAWASTSRSMRMLNGGEISLAERSRAALLRQSFRLGIIGAVIIAMATRLVFPWVLTAYIGADEFIFYFVLFQAYGLLLFDELNYLVVTGRNRMVIAGYAALLVLTLLPAYLFPSLTFPTIAKLGIGFYFLLAVAATAYCRKLGGMQGIVWVSKFAFLLFPVGCVLLYTVSGFIGVTIACGFVAVCTLQSWHKARQHRA